MSVLLIDHLVAFVLLVAYPVLSYRGFRRLLADAAAGRPIDRAGIYLKTVATHWALCAAVIVVWLLADRDAPTLGFSFAAGSGFAAGLGIVGASIAALAWQVVRMRRSGDGKREQFRQQLGHVSLILPRNDRELSRFNLLSVTAGIVEEVLWRGYLFWYLGAYMPLWAAAAVSTAGFALGHSYQGFANVPKIAVVGAAFAILYVMTGSLWLPIVLHAAVDLLQGRLAFEILRDNGNTRPAAV